MISVVVPAHDESSTIAQCLSALTSTLDPGEIDVVVVCNGCSDDTEAIARSFGPPVRVLSLPSASKIAALNAGDRAAATFPRLYVDGDVELLGPAVRELAYALERGPLLAASPGLQIDDSRSSWPVRCYYRLWSELPSVRTDLVGRGVYGLSALGRARFGTFPDVVADDHFIRCQFSSEERGIVASCHSTVRAPRTLRGLLHRSVRVHRGNRAMTLGTPPASSERASGVVSAGRRDRWWPLDLPVYLMVRLATRAVDRWGLHGISGTWARDDSRPTGHDEQEG